jgi:thioredoxin-like negative regulator of GroEL
MIQAVTDADFDRALEQAAVPVLVEFWKPGCGGCRSLMVELEEIQTALASRILILTMNVEENYQIPSELDISSLPALALYRHGEFERFIGGVGKKDEILKQIRLEEVGGVTG